MLGYFRFLLGIKKVYNRKLLCPFFTTQKFLKLSTQKEKKEIHKFTMNKNSNQNLTKCWRWWVKTKLKYSPSIKVSLRLKILKPNLSCRPFWIWSDDKNIYVTDSKQNTVYIFLRLRSTCRWNKSNMATFEKSLETKLKTLEPTQTGIQTLSLWIIHHRQHSDIITSKWIERVKKGMYC